MIPFLLMYIHKYVHTYIKGKQNRNKNNSILETGEMTEKQITKDKLVRWK